MICIAGPAQECTIGSMKTACAISALILVSGALETSALGWAMGGHRVISLVAWEKTSPATRAKFVSLIEQHPEFAGHFAAKLQAELGASPAAESRERWLFAQAAIWPDLVRPPLDGSPNPNEKYHRPMWHYLDLPVFGDADAKARLEAGQPKIDWKWKPGLPDFLERKLNASQVIDKAMKTIGDAAQPASERAVMLCWLVHVAGDVHQPCHCSSLFTIAQLPKGDRGGNSIQIKESDAGNLHVYWDDLLGGPGLGFDEAGKAARELLADQAVMAKAAAAAKALDPEAWIREGAAAAQEAVYPQALINAVLKATPQSYEKNGVRYDAVGPLELGADAWKAYDEKAYSLALERAAAAGLRLAAALEAALGKGG